MCHEWTGRLVLRVPEDMSVLMVHETGTQVPERDRAWRPPGGRKELEDADWIATAIRETDEETGLKIEPERVMPIADLRKPGGRMIYVGFVDLSLGEAQQVKYDLSDTERPGFVRYDDIHKPKHLGIRIHPVYRRIMVEHEIIPPPS